MSAIVINAAQGESAPASIRLLPSREIAEMALQKVGAFTPNDEGANPSEVERALDWMEIEIGHLSGVHRLQWLIPTTVEFDLEDEIAEYVLAEVLGSAYPSLGVAYPIRAYRGTVQDVDDEDEVVNFVEIPIVRRAQYEAFRDRNASGVTDWIYIDRLNDSKNLFVYPTQNAGVNVRLRLLLQTYPRSVQGPGNEDAAGDTGHGFPVEWQKWLILQTSAAIGDGPVRRLDSKTLGDIRVSAERALIELMGAQNREKVTHRLHRTRRYGG